MDEARSLQYSINFQTNAGSTQGELQSLVSTIGSIGSSAANLGSTLQSSLGSGLSSSGALADSLESGVGGALADAGIEANGLAADLGGLAQEASAAAKSTEGLGQAAQSSSREATSLGSAFRQSFLAGIDGGNSFASSMKAGVGGAISFAGNKVTEFKDKAVNGLQSIGHGLAHPIDTIRNGLGNAIQGAKDKFIDMARSAEKAADSTEGVGDSAGGTGNDIDGMGDSAEEAEGDIRSLGSAADESGSKFEGLGNIVKSVAAGIGIAIGVATTAVTGFAASSVNVGMEFDSSMSQVAATMGYSVEELNTVGSEANQTFSELRNFAMEMGSSTAFSASQAADALNYMALAGYDSEKSMAMLPNVLNLAAAGGMELADASDMVTDAQSALGLTMDETAEMVDKMAMASSKSNTSVSQLGSAILTVGGTAKNLAGGTTELSMALGVLADNGVKGAEGGTALRNIIMSLSAPTEKATAALQNMGIEAFDAEGNLRPLNETFGELNAALGSMTQQEQTQTLNEIFNKTDLKSVNALLATSAERWDELGGCIDNASGAAANMAETQLDNLAGDITMFKSALEGAQIIISDGLTPDLRQFVQFGTDSISTLSTAFQEGGLSGAMEAFGTILSDGISMIMGMLPGMVDAGMQLLGALGQGLLDNLPVITGAATDIIIMLAQGIILALPQIVGAAAQVIGTLATGLGDALPELIPMAVGAILSIAETIIDNLPLLLDAGMQIIEGLGQGILDSIPLLVEKLPELINQVVTFVEESLPQFLEEGIQILTSLGMGIIEAIPQLTAQLPSVISGITGFMNENLPTILEQGVQMIVTLGNGILTAIPQLVSQLPAIITSTVDFITSNLPIIVEQGINLIVQLAQGILQAIPQLVAALPSIISAVVDGLAQLPGMVLNIGVNIVQGLWNGISSMAGWLWDQVSGWASGLMSNIKGFFGIHSPSTVFAEIGKFMGLGVGIGFTGTMDKVSEDMESAIPTSFDMPALNTPALPEFATAVPDTFGMPEPQPIVYIVAPLVEGINIPPISDMMYSVKPEIEEFDPPDVSAAALYNPDDSDSDTPDLDDDSPDGRPRPYGPGGQPPSIVFSPVINIYVQGSVDDETIAKLRAELRDEMKAQYEELRKQELEQMALKEQYAF